MSITGQIVSEIVARQLCLENSIQTLLNFFGVDPKRQVVFKACVAFRLFSRRLSPLGCFYGVCNPPVSRFWRVSLSLQFHGVFHILLSIQCSQRVSLTTCFHGMYHLQVVFMACVALRLAAFLALDVFRLVFITCFALIFYFRRGCRSQVSSAFIARIPLFMVFAA